jgi:peptidyl-tRNA hydrolase, PTH1 family
VAGSTWLVVGLGNAAEQYQKTRHNIGVMAVAQLAQELKLGFSRHKKTNSFIAEVKTSENKIVLAYLDCYMNESGSPTKSLLNFFDIQTENLIVLHDELDLDFCDLRIKFSGGDNGHNGLKSIRSAVNSGDFYRVRLGIGRPITQQDPASYVLEKFSKTEIPLLPQYLTAAAAATQLLIEKDLTSAQNLFNKKAGQNE